MQRGTAARAALAPVSTQQPTAAAQQTWQTRLCYRALWARLAERFPGEDPQDVLRRAGDVDYAELQKEPT